MNKIALFLSFQLSILFTIGSMAPAFAQQSSCPSGLVFDNALNRCLTSAQTAQIMNATASCPPGDVKCYRDNAESALKGKVASGEVKEQLKDKGGNIVAGASAIALPLLLAASGLKSSSPCAAPSHIAMIGGGTALAVGDLLSTTLHKKRLKAIEKEWQSIVKPGTAKETNSDSKRVNATEAQSQAFEMLARSEDSMESAAKMKSIFFAAAMGAFSASAVLATLEIFHPAGICKEKKKAESNNSGESPKPDEAPYLQRRDAPQGINIKPGEVINPNNAHIQPHSQNEIALQMLKYYLEVESKIEASTSSLSYEKFHIHTKGPTQPEEKDLLYFLKTMTINIFWGLNPIENSYAFLQNSKVETSKLMISPASRAILSGILAGWSYTMYSHAKKQAQISKDRAVLLRKMKDEFKDATGAINSCTVDERNNPSSPNCYCYTSEGQRNTARSSSQICNKLFTGKNLSGKKTSINAESGAPKGCISSGGTFDEKCSCKASKSCLKATPNNLQGFNPGSFSMLSNALSPVDRLGNGTAGSANVSEDAVVNGALRLLSAQKKLEEKKELSKFKARKDQMKNKIEGSLMASGSGTSPNFLGSNSSALPTSPTQAAVLLEKEIEDESSSVSKTSANGEGLSIPSGSSKDENLEFGMTADQLADQETQIAQVMQENLDYGGNDINNGSSANIFELLSSRYQRSGMRRLFDENGKLPAEPAAKTDISDK